MRTSKFTETQIISTLKQADASVPAKDIYRQVDISTAAYYDWKGKWWAAAGLVDTLLRWKMKAEVVYGNETAVRSGIQG